MVVRLENTTTALGSPSPMHMSVLLTRGTYAVLTASVGDYELSVPTLLASKIHAQLSGREKSSFLYMFDYKMSVRSPADPVGHDWLKYSANHADELLFMFDLDVSNLLVCKCK
mgnify:CR=1 FL=1